MYLQAWLAEFLPEWLALLVTLAWRPAVVSFIGVAALLFIWAERKVSARIQDRLGPTRTGRRPVQSLADGIKLLTKEDSRRTRRQVPVPRRPVLERFARRSSSAFLAAPCHSQRPRHPGSERRRVLHLAC